MIILNIEPINRRHFTDPGLGLGLGLVLGLGLGLGLGSIFHFTDPGDIAVRHSGFRRFAPDPCALHRCSFQCNCELKTTRKTTTRTD